MFRELYGLWQSYEEELSRLGDWMEGTERDVNDLVMRVGVTGGQQEQADNTKVQKLLSLQFVFQWLSKFLVVLFVF